VTWGDDVMVEAASTAALRCRWCRKRVTVSRSKSPVTQADRHISLAVHTDTGLESCADGLHLAAPIEPLETGTGDSAATVGGKRKPTPAELGGCVEIAADLPGAVAVRDSKDPGGGVHVVDRAAFGRFLADVKNGRFGI
jgi:hypothetical protein